MATEMATLLLNEHEKQVMAIIKNDNYTFDDLVQVIEAEIDKDGSQFVHDMYKRAVINKVVVKGKTYYKSSNFYNRIAYFCQYENETWMTVSENTRDQIDVWYVNAYAIGAEPRLKEIHEGKRELIENAYFFTLQETLDLIDELDKDIYVVPCNCRSVADNCDKPRGVCLLFETGINTEWDRGHGKPLTKDEAKEIVIDADKKGLMHTSETDMAICNCCGCCCYPIRASEIIGATGNWPKRRYDIKWDEEKCIHCGKCAKACNFEAFTSENRKVSFDQSKCIGCTICENHCPVGVIALTKLEELPTT